MNAASAQQKASHSQPSDISSETSIARRSFSLPQVNSGTMMTTGYSFYPHPPSTQHQSSMGIVSPLTYHSQSGFRTVSTDRGANGSLSSIHEHLNPISPTPSNGMSNYVWNSHTNSFSSVGDSSMAKNLLPKHPPNSQMKHERNSEIGPSHMNGSTLVPVPFCSDDPSQQHYASATKKQRPNGYIAPKQIPDSFTSRVGSHVVASANMRASTGAMNAAGSNHPNDQVPKQVIFRRQLSSGKIECFLHGDNHDSMDVETAESRPRSMSF
jgi:hypothetical protein